MADSLAEQLFEKAKGQPAISWLVVMPASGTAQRFTGVLLQADMKEGGRACFVVHGHKVIAIESRAIVYDAFTLKVAWNPRHHTDLIHPAAREWFARNPDVFSLDRPAEVRPL